MVAESALVVRAQDIGVERASVKRAMMQLSAEHHEILVLVCAKDMSYGEVSDVLQIPVDTVRSRLSRARSELQTIMDTPPALAAGTATAILAYVNMPVIPRYFASQALQKRRR